MAAIVLGVLLILPCGCGEGAAPSGNPHRYVMVDVYDVSVDVQVAGGSTEKVKLEPLGTAVYEELSTSGEVVGIRMTQLDPQTSRKLVHVDLLYETGEGASKLLVVLHDPSVFAGIPFLLRSECWEMTGTGLQPVKGKTATLVPKIWQLSLSENITYPCTNVLSLAKTEMWNCVGQLPESLSPFFSWRERYMSIKRGESNAPSFVRDLYGLQG